jgi:hypothetical protein
MMDIGVARPSAHGHAMISTDTAFTNAYAIAGTGPQTDQTIGPPSVATILKLSGQADAGLRASQTVVRVAERLKS